MTAKRQVAAVEASLDPLAIVLRVIAEGQEHASFVAHARAIAEQPVDVAPLTRIGKQVEASVRGALKGRPRAEVEAAVWREISDAFFRYVLFIRINLAAHELADRQGLIAATAFFWLSSLLARTAESDVAPDELDGYRAELRVEWRRWRWVVASIRLALIVEDDAREQLEARYLGGRSSLLTEGEAEWDGLADQVERL